MQTTSDRISNAERVAALRKRRLQRKTLIGQNTLPATARSLRGSEHVASWQVRCGLRTRDCLKSVRLAVDDLELLMGRLAPEADPDSPAERAEAEAYLQRYPAPLGQSGHCGEVWHGTQALPSGKGTRRSPTYVFLRKGADLCVDSVD